jgi:hypothetical protein
MSQDSGKEVDEEYYSHTHELYNYSIEVTSQEAGMQNYNQNATKSLDDTDDSDMHTSPPLPLVLLGVVNN